MQNRKHFLLTACFVFSLLALPISAEAAKLRAGPMAGAAYMRGVKLWMQADVASLAVIEYWDTAATQKILRTPPQKLIADEDFVGQFTIGGLEPGLTYGYRVKIDGKVQEVGQSLIFRTQTLWKWRTDAPDWKLALGSCAYTNEAAYDRPGKPYGGPPANLNIYDSIARQKPDMMLWAGDYLYHREVDYDSEWGMRYRWNRERGMREVQRLLQTGNHYAIWDDHEFGPNDSNASFVLKGESLKLFKRFVANPSFGLPEAPGTFGNFLFNDAEFFLTDNRYYRDSDLLQADDKSMLGPAQLRWLKNALLGSDSPVKFIVVGSQVTNNTMTIYEGWHKFPRERDDFFKFLVDHKIEGVMFLSGDQHFTELLKTKRLNAYPLYELTCSSLTAGSHSDDGTNKINPDIVPGTFTQPRNFCTIDFSGKLKERKLTVRSFSTEGEKLWEKDIALSELQMPK